MDNRGDLIALDEATAAARVAGTDPDALVDAARSGRLDTVQIGGLPYVSASELDLWVRLRDDPDATDLAGAGSLGSDLEETDLAGSDLASAVASAVASLGLPAGGRATDRPEQVAGDLGVAGGLGAARPERPGASTDAPGGH
ncbi:MAG: hypothetical protein M0T80_12880 [Actinomycetota bacterium]|nr:hypothetical protein [Actinomycetota bacterium]